MGEVASTVWPWGASHGWGAHRTRDGEFSDQLFLDAHPRSVLIEEEFFYAQDISENWSTEVDSLPRGRVELRLPYDGDRFLPHDVGRALGGRLDGRDRRPPRRRNRNVVTDWGGPETTDIGNEVRAGTDPSARGWHAVAGHLVFTDYEDTDLSERLPLEARHGAVPLRVPVRSRSLPDAESLTDGAHEYRWNLDYAPAPTVPAVVPIDVEVEIDDQDNTRLADRMAEIGADVSEDDALVRAMTQYVGFRPELTLRLRGRVTVTLPRGREVRPPILRRMAVELPNITSLSGQALTLRIGAIPTPFHYDPCSRSAEWSDVPMVEESTSDVTSVRSRTATVRTTFRTALMHLAIDQPGELFGRDELLVRAEAELPDVLLSGTDARLFDARGRWRGPTPARPHPVPTGDEPWVVLPPRRDELASRSGTVPLPVADGDEDTPADDPKTAGETGRSDGRRAANDAAESSDAAIPHPRLSPENTPPSRDDQCASTAQAEPDEALDDRRGEESLIVRSVVHTRCTVSLHDAFERRIASPHHRLHFDEIVPDRARVADVENALAALGFETAAVDLSGLRQYHESADLLSWVTGHRSDQMSGENAALIWVLVRGVRNSTRRQSERGGGTTYTTRLKTGELFLDIRGRTHGNTHGLTVQMNELHRRLKDRFSQMRSQQ